MSFYLIREQKDSRCHFTIGCGLRMTKLVHPNGVEPSTMEEAETLALSNKDYLGTLEMRLTDSRVSSAQILEVTAVKDIDLAAFEQACLNWSADRVEEYERAQYERLKARYEDETNL